MSSWNSFELLWITSEISYDKWPFVITNLKTMAPSYSYISSFTLIKSEFESYLEYIALEEVYAFL